MRGLWQVERGVKDINALKRLPRISEAKARKLLGPLADSLPKPTGFDEIVDPSVPSCAP